jgi:hypothetical protein
MRLSFVGLGTIIMPAAELIRSSNIKLNTRVVLHPI